jgi:hypothetical protein
MRSFAQGKVSGVGIRNIPVNENILDGVVRYKLDDFVVIGSISRTSHVTLLFFSNSFCLRQNSSRNQLYFR